MHARKPIPLFQIRFAGGVRVLSPSRLFGSRPWLWFEPDTPINNFSNFKRNLKAHSACTLCHEHTEGCTHALDGDGRKGCR